MIEGTEALSFLLTPGLGLQEPHAPVSHEFKASIIDNAHDFDAIEAGWAGLMRVAAHGRNFLNDPAHVREFLSSHGSLSPLIMVVMQDDRLVGIAPFLVSDERIPIRLSLLKLASVPMRRLRLLSESFVIAPGVDVQIFHHFVFEEVARATDFDVMHLHELREDGALWRFLNNPAIPTPAYHLAYATEPQTSHDIDLQGGHADYERALKSENRKKLRKRRRLLTEQFGGDVRLVAVREAGQVDDFLNAVDRIAKHTWQARAYGPRTHNAATDIAHFKFLAERGWLRSYLLIGGGEPLAFQISVQYAEQFHFLETGYDSRWSKLGPGNVLQTMLIEDLFSVDKPRFADYGFGEGESKRILGNISSRRWEHVFMVRSRATYPRAVFFGIGLAARTEAGVRKILEWTGSERFVRDLLKRRGGDQ